MYFSLGPNKVKTNFIDLYCRNDALTGLTRDNCFNKIKSSYINIISEYIPIEISGLDEDVPFLKVNDSERCIKLCKEYNLSRLDDLSQTDIIKKSTYDVSEREMIKYLEALEYIKNQSKELYEVFSLVINVIFFMRSQEASGGSTSGLPGVIWVNPKSHWSIEDRAEFLIHEMTHNLLFIEEIIRGLYSYDDMYREENWTRSAVLNKFRPLDKSFHSAVVGTELLLYRNEFNLEQNKYCAHPPTDKLLSQTYDSLESCLNSHLLSKRGREILGACKKELEGI